MRCDADEKCAVPTTGLDQAHWFSGPGWYLRFHAVCCPRTVDDFDCDLTHPETDEPIPPDEVLPCGCVTRCSIENGVKTLTLIPCRADCVNFRNTMALSAKKGIEPEFRRAP